MTNFSLTTPSFMDAEEDYFTMDNDTVNSQNSSRSSFARDLKLTVTVSFICVVCIFGFVGNGIVIWLLGFCMKRNPFTTYILNLAVADFGVLISSVSFAVLSIVDIQLSATPPPLYLLFMIRMLFYCAYSTSQFLLTAISIDRCLAVLFPLWYRCHRPKNLSTILCAFIWILCFLFNGIFLTLDLFQIHIYLPSSFYVFLGNAVLCLPLITISTLILLSRVCFKAQLRHRGKLLVVIILTLVFFLILAFPLNVIVLINIVGWNANFDSYHLILSGLLCTSLNSFVNPLIYFLVGRKKRGLCKENMKLILQRVFMEEEIHGEELESSVQTLHPHLR